jgi:hypothetical protein
MRFLVIRRSTLLVPAVIAALAVPVAPALAGEEDDSDARLDLSPQTCVSNPRVKAAVSGDDIDSVRFFVDDRLVRTVNNPAATGRFVFGMRCATLSVGAHRARAVVNFGEGETETLRFQITRAAQGSPRFTG